MNKTERQMRDLLRMGREKYGYVRVKAEFEAEGTRMDELLRLVEIAHSAGLPLTVKIGGCEAIRDLLESKQIGVRYVVAPMVETPVRAVEVHRRVEHGLRRGRTLDTDFLFNMETITGFDHREAIAERRGPRTSTGSCSVESTSPGLSASTATASTTTRSPSTCSNVSGLCHDYGIDLVVGGAVSIDAMPALKRSVRAT